ncbi:MAG: hypothetical protein JWO11_3662 [Nocardioides sp.]|nr:hypothetical protein [Nocardioides sp.]
MPKVMLMETTIAATAAAAALVSGVFVWLQVREMQRQTKLQREIAEAAAQPYVWADFRVSADNGWGLGFVLGNSGPTMARNVRVHIDPPLPADQRASEFIDRVRPKLERGLASLAPGHQLDWTLGGSPELVNKTEPMAHTIRIEYDGPFGPVEPTEFRFDFDDLRETTARHFGTLHAIRQSVDKLTDKFPRSQG